VTGFELYFEHTQEPELLMPRNGLTTDKINHSICVQKEKKKGDIIIADNKTWQNLKFSPRLNHISHNRERWKKMKRERD